MAGHSGDVTAYLSSVIAARAQFTACTYFLVLVTLLPASAEDGHSACAAYASARLFYVLFFDELLLNQTLAFVLKTVRSIFVVKALLIADPLVLACLHGFVEVFLFHIVHRLEVGVQQLSRAFDFKDWL